MKYHDRMYDAVVEVVKEVLATGVDVDQRYESETMLMKAADGGQAELVR